MDLLIRNFTEKRHEELIKIINKEDLAIEIICKNKIDSIHLKSMINKLFKYIYNYNNLSAFDLKSGTNVIIIERKNITYVIYKKHLVKLSKLYRFIEEKTVLLFNDLESFVPVKLITLGEK